MNGTLSSLRADSIFRFYSYASVVGVANLVFSIMLLLEVFLMAMNWQGVMDFCIDLCIDIRGGEY